MMSLNNLIDFSKARDYTWADAGYLAYDFGDSLDVIKEVAAHHAALVREKRERLKGYISNDEFLASSNEPEEYKAQYMAQRYDYIEVSNNNFEYSVNSASVMAAVAALEAQLKTACRFLKEELQLTIEPRQMKASTGKGDLDKFREYIVSQVGIDSSGSDQYFSAIRAYKEVRNIFVHDPSYYVVTQKFKASVQNINHVAIITEFGEERLRFDWMAFIPAMIKVFDSYFTKLMEEVDDAFKIRRKII